MTIHKRLRNFRLRQKLLGIVGIPLLATVVLTALTFQATSQSQHAIEWVDHSKAVIQLTNDLQSSIYAMQSNYRNFALTGDGLFLNGGSTAITNFETYIARLKEETADNPDQQARWQRIDMLVAAWQEKTVQPGIALRQQVDAGTGDITAAYNWITEDSGRQQFSAILSEVNTSALAEQDLLAGRIDRVKGESEQIRTILVGGTALIIVLSLAATSVIANDVSRAMARLTLVAQRVANGDYSQRTELERTDEIGQTAAAFDSMSQTLQTTIVDLSNTADQSRRSETHTRAVLDNVAEGIITFSPRGVIESVNPAARAMFQHPDGELIGMPIGTIVSLGSSSGDETNQEQDQDQASRRSLHNDALGHRADGTSFPIEMVISQMALPDAPRFIAVVRNISPLVAAEQGLRIRNRELEDARSISRAVLDATGEGVILISPQHKIVTINKQFSEFFGVEDGDVGGQPMNRYSDLLDRIFIDPDRFRQVLYDTIDDPDARHTALITQQWPTHRELEYFTTPVKTGNNVLLGRIFSFRDVTREREVDRMKTEFVSLVSHELRTPLTSIKGYVDLLLEGEVGDLEPEQREFLEIVGSNADRLVALIGELLDISRIEAGKVELNLTSNDLNYVLSGLAMSFRPQFEAKQQTLQATVPADTPTVLADTARLNQILTNLLSNAHKYSPVGSSIDIRVGHIDGSVSIAVRDNGIGLTQEEQQRLFTRFFRASNRATQEAGGTGLGLAITRSLVELHGGTISAESEPGHGSTFTVTFPASSAAARASTTVAPAAPQATHPAHGRILIVEDEPDIANLMRRYLERAGFVVVTASNAANALQMAQRMPFDLITLDVLLPDNDGFSVLEALKSSPDTCDIPVMMLSMLPDEGEGRRLGAVDYLVKPVAEGVLVDHIRTLLATAPIAAAGTILIADDDADIRKLIASNLTRAGYEVLTASNGEEALAILQEQHIDLLLLDVRMPVMDGITALRRLRANDATKSQAVVMMTASPGAVSDITPVLTHLGVQDLLLKPLTAAELAATIEKTLTTLRGAQA